MTQLIIGGVTLPEARNGKYKCYVHEENEDLRMTDGTLVSELGYKYYKIEYSFDYLSNNVYQALLAALRTGAPVDTLFLPDDNSTELLRGMFKCPANAMPKPQYAFSRSGKPYWHNISFSLEGVEPIA